MISTADLFDTRSHKIFRPIVLVLASRPELRLGLLAGSPTTFHANAGVSTACSSQCPAPEPGTGHCPGPWTGYAINLPSMTQRNAVPIRSLRSGTH